MKIINKMICADDDICDEDPWRGSCVHSHAVSVLFEVTWKANCMDGVTQSRRVCVCMLTGFCFIDLHTYLLTP